MDTTGLRNKDELSELLSLITAQRKKSVERICLPHFRAELRKLISNRKLFSESEHLSVARLQNSEQLFILTQLSCSRRPEKSLRSSDISRSCTTEWTMRSTLLLTLMPFSRTQFLSESINSALERISINVSRKAEGSISLDCANRHKDGILFTLIYKLITEKNRAAYLKFLCNHVNFHPY